MRCKLLHFCAWCLTYLNMFHQFFEIRYCAMLSDRHIQKTYTEQTCEHDFFVSCFSMHLCLCILLFPDLQGSNFQFPFFLRLFLFMFFFPLVNWKVSVVQLWWPTTFRAKKNRKKNQNYIHICGSTTKWRSAHVISFATSKVFICAHFHVTMTPHV